MKLKRNLLKMQDMAALCVRQSESGNFHSVSLLYVKKKKKRKIQDDSIFLRIKRANDKNSHNIHEGFFHNIHIFKDRTQVKIYGLCPF